MSGSEATPGAQASGGVQAPDGRSRRVLAVVAVGVVAVLVVAVLLLRHGGASGPAATAGGPTSSAGTTAGATPTGTDTAGGTTALGTSGGPTDGMPTAPLSTPVPTTGIGGRPAQQVAIGATASPLPQVTAALTGITAIQGVAALPGEVSGPALSITVTMTNGSSAPIDLSLVAVNAYYGAALTPAITLSTGTQAFSGTLAPGASASGTYVETVPLGERGDVTVELDVSTEAMLTLFRGAAPA